VREPSQRLTQHKRLGGRSLSVSWDREEAPALHFKGSKPGAVPAGWSPFRSVSVAENLHPAHHPCAIALQPFRMAWPQSASADLVHVEHPRGAEGETHGSVRAGEPCDRLIAGLADAQHGVVGRGQLLAGGIGRGAIRARLARGALHLVHRGVYAVGYPTLSVRGRWMAAVLALGPQAVLSHRSAAELWGLLPPATRAIEVTRPTNARPRRLMLIHCASIANDERTVVDGIPVTATPRTILDLAAVASRRQVERALNEIEVRGLTDRLSIPDLLERYPRRPGTAVLRAVLGGDSARSGVTRSELEERFLSLLEAHDLPRPRLNADLAVDGRFFMVDCLWARDRLIVELDGQAVHGTRGAFEADRERDRLLLADGWRVMRITWRQLHDDSAGIVRSLRSAFEFRSR
jgi:very-short-patch-repair endonuclease